MLKIVKQKNLKSGKYFLHNVYKIILMYYEKEILPIITSFCLAKNAQITQIILDTILYSNMKNVFVVKFCFINLFILKLYLTPLVVSVAPLMANQLFNWSNWSKRRTTRATSAHRLCEVSFPPDCEQVAT